MFFEIPLWLGAAVSGIALLLGNRTAAPLLASYGLTTVLCAIGYYNIAVWLLIDSVVIAIIAARKTTLGDKIILSLFPVAWVGYALESITFIVTWAVVMAQFLITVPWQRLARGLAGAAPKVRDHDDFDLRVLT